MSSFSHKTSSTLIRYTAITLFIQCIFLLVFLYLIYPEHGMLLLFVVIAINGAVLAFSLLFIKTFAKKQLVLPLEMIISTANQVIGGMPSARVPIQLMGLTEFKMAGEAINLLADKASKDIAELKKLEQVRSQFLGNVSHELRTPIFSIQGYLETLLDGAIDDDKVRRKFVERAHANAIRLNVLLSDLIDISKIESGEMRMSYRYFNLADIIKDVLNALEYQAHQYHITLHNNAENEEITVYGDKERIGQALTNLIENAIKYNTPGGTVDVKIDLSQEDVIINIKDTGIGIAPEHQDRIFERFYRVDKDRSRAVGGSGLGLAIVKHILEAHNSQLEITSIPEQGTCISFVLKR